MKRWIVPAVVVAVIIAWVGWNLRSGESEAGPSQVTWSPLDQAEALARSGHKKILVDVYTDWCSWCKKLDKEVYPEANVSAMLAKEFVAVRVNAESSTPVTFAGKTMTEQEFAAANGVSGYPTILFFDENGKQVTNLPGFLPADKFIHVLRYVADGKYTSVSLDDYFRSL